MAAPNAEVLLEVWEGSAGAHAARRALALLNATWPRGQGEAGWAEAPLGQRDAWLIELHRTLFGAELATATRCPRCRERLELSFTAEDMGLPTLSEPEPARTHALTADGYSLIWRAPDSEALLTAANAQDADVAYRRLLGACVVSAQEGERPAAPAELPESVVAALAEAITAADPGAEIRVDLSCAECGFAWDIGFDISVLLSAELDDWAQRLLADVHALALAYGWSEGEVLRLSPLRRQIYLDLVRA